MVWTKVSLTTALLGVVLSSAAYGQEPLWRGSNPDVTDLVPAYAGNLSPFPMRKAADELLPPPVLTEPSLTEADHKAIEAASVLTEIRKLLKEDVAFTPDFSLIQVRAITIGPKGATALISNQWQRQGAILFVPMMQNNGIIGMLSRLQTLDPNLAGVVREEVNGRVLKQGPAAMRIAQITRQAVEVTDPEGKKHKLPFVASGW